MPSVITREVQYEEGQRLRVRGGWVLQEDRKASSCSEGVERAPRQTVVPHLSLLQEIGSNEPLSVARLGR